MLSHDSSEADCDILQTVDLPEKVVNDQAEMRMTPHQSTERSTTSFPYIDRHIYTIYETEGEKSTLSLELRQKRALYSAVATGVKLTHSALSQLSLSSLKM